MAITLGALDHCVDLGNPLSSVLAAHEHPVLLADRNRPDRVLGKVVFRFARVPEEASSAEAQSPSASKRPVVAPCRIHVSYSRRSHSEAESLQRSKNKKVAEIFELSPASESLAMGILGSVRHDRSTISHWEVLSIGKKRGLCSRRSRYSRSLSQVSGIRTGNSLIVRTVAWPKATSTMAPSRPVVRVTVSWRPAASPSRHFGGW